MAERIKGQEVIVKFIKDGQIVDEISAIQSCDFTYDMATLSEGYLGETTDRKDDVFHGISGSMEVHDEDGGIFAFIESIVERARRKVPLFQVDLMGVFQYPSGAQKKILIPDCRFGKFPVKIGGRASYVGFSIEFEASEAKSVS